METKTINLRDLPEDLVRRAKAYAALCGITLKDLVIKAIESEIENDIKVGFAKGSFLGAIKKTRRSKARK